MERHLIASIQRRQGPNVSGLFGLLQPLSDGVKLILKELFIPSNANTLLFLLSPIIVFVFALLQFVQIPIPLQAQSNTFFISLTSMLLFLALGSLASVGIFLSGWSSNSKYALLVTVRAISQIIGYELTLSTLFLVLSYLCFGYSISFIVEMQQKTISFWIAFFPLMCLLFIIFLAETNRSPFDLPEGESEIVAGFNVEYSGFLFALFFLGEYAKMLVTSIWLVLLFFKGGFLFQYSMQTLFIIKVLFIAYLFILIRAIVPRYRIDQLMSLGWTIFLPITFLCYLSVLLFTGYTF